MQKVVVEIEWDPEIVHWLDNPDQISRALSRQLGQTFKVKDLSGLAKELDYWKSQCQRCSDDNVALSMLRAKAEENAESWRSYATDFYRTSKRLDIATTALGEIHSIQRGITAEWTIAKDALTSITELEGKDGTDTKRVPNP